jgi:hypothetical protein
MDADIYIDNKAFSKVLDEIFRLKFIVIEILLSWFIVVKLVLGCVYEII